MDEMALNTLRSELLLAARVLEHVQFCAAFDVPASLLGTVQAASAGAHWPELR